MKIVIDPVNNQAEVSRFVPARTKIVVYTENGDNSGWLKQLAVASFRILDARDNTVYLRGNIIFFVGRSFDDKYSFLTGFSTSKEINLDANYSCQSASNGTVFQNQITLTGFPVTPVTDYDNPGKNSPQICGGLHSSNFYLEPKDGMITDWPITLLPVIPNLKKFL